MADGVDCAWLTPVAAFLVGRKAGVSSVERDGERGCASHGIAALPIATQPKLTSQRMGSPRCGCAFKEQDLGLGSSKRVLQ